MTRPTTAVKVYRTLLPKIKISSTLLTMKSFNSKEFIVANGNFSKLLRLNKLLA